MIKNPGLFTWVAWHFSLNYNLNCNYKITSTIQITGGESKNLVGLKRGIKDSENFFAFVSNNDGAFSVIKYFNNAAYTIVPFKGFDKDSKNYKLEVRRKGSKWQFYTDHQFFADAPVEDLPGKSIGFIVSDDIILEVDDIKVVFFK